MIVRVPGVVHWVTVVVTPSTAVIAAYRSSVATPVVDMAMRSKGRAPFTALMRVVRTEVAPTIMVTTKVIPMMTAAPVTEVWPGLHVVFSRAMADRIPGKVASSARMRASSRIEAAGNAPRSVRGNPPKAPRDFVPLLSERYTAATAAQPVIAMGAPMMKWTVCFLRTVAPTSFTGARAATEATREAA